MPPVTLPDTCTCPIPSNFLSSIKTGSERETVAPPDGMGVLIFGDSGYTRQDERDGLEQSAGLAGVSGIRQRDRRTGQKAEAGGSAEARKRETDLVGLGAEARRGI